MATSLECLGLADPGDDDLAALESAVGRIPGRLPVVANDGELDLLRYDDPSGVRLTLAQTRDRQIVGVLPTYTGRPGARLHDLRVTTDLVAIADVHERADDEDPTTRLACDLVQAVFVPPAGCSGPAAITALAHDVTVYDDVPAYVASLGDGLPWGAESFVPVGLFGDGPPTPFARLSGIVLESSTRRVEITGRDVHVARVRSAGFEADVLLAPGEHPELPRVGAVVNGVVYLIAEMEQLFPRLRRRWLARRR